MLSRSKYDGPVVTGPDGEIRRMISREEIRENPCLEWNTFVELVIMSKYEELSQRQRGAHLAMWYSSEVNNGGHLQYFENRGTEHVDETIGALRAIGGETQAKILVKARDRYFSHARQPIQTVFEYVAQARQGEYDDLDMAFYDATPTIDELLEKHLQEHKEWYLEIAN